MKTLLYNEIANTHLFDMESKAFHAHARMFITHYRELSDEEKQKEPAPRFLLAASSGFAQKVYLGRGDRIARWEDLDETDIIINCIRFEGPIMRNGGACAYGSKELRDMIMEAANVPQCIGHIFIVDTPGGSTYAKYDFKEALDYAHEKGQQTVLYVDGMLMSAGMAWGACCQKIIAHAPYCMLGCMGTFGAFYTQKNKDVNTVTQEMFHEIYATTSPNKNKIFRKAAQGDDEEAQAYVDRENEKYLQFIRQGRPAVTDEQLLGDEYEAGQVIGTLCDGIQSFDEVVNDMLTAAGVTRGNTDADKKKRQTGLLLATEETRNRKLVYQAKGTAEKHDDDDDDPDEDDPDRPGDPNKPVDPEKPEEPEDNSTNEETKPLNSNTHMKQYNHIREALGLEAFEHDSQNGIYLVEEYADTIDSRLGQFRQAQETIEAKHNEIKQLNETIRQLREQLAENERKANEVDEQRKNEREQEQKNFREQIEQLNNTIAEKDNLIAELSEQPQPRKQPETIDHTGEEQKTSVLISGKGTVDAQRKAYAKRMKQLNERRGR